MNFLAMPTLKNERACFLRPISISLFRSLNDKFDSARMGMANVGSLDRSAAEITMSAMPMSFFSTAVVFFCLVVIVGYFFRLVPGVRGAAAFFPAAFDSAAFSNSAIWSLLRRGPVGEV